MILVVSQFLLVFNSAFLFQNLKNLSTDTKPNVKNKILQVLLTYSLDYNIDNVSILLLKSLSVSRNGLKWWWCYSVNSLTYRPSTESESFLVEGRTRIFWMKREGSCHCCYGTLRKPCSFSRFEVGTRFFPYSTRRSCISCTRLRVYIRKYYSLSSSFISFSFYACQCFSLLSLLFKNNKICFSFGI